MSADLVINLFSRAYALRLAAGRLLGVDELGFVDASLGADGGDLCIPSDGFVRLLSGYRTLGDLHDAWPDTVVRAERRAVVEALFPRIASYITMPY